MSEARSRTATRLLPRYVDHRARDCAAIRAALEHHDFEAIVRVGHNLRGNGPAFGFPELAGLGEALELAARTRNVAGVEDQLGALEAWITANRASIRPSGVHVRARGPGASDDDEDA